MTELRIPASQPTSVGDMLKIEFLEPLNISQGKLAEAMGVGRQTVSELCTGRRRVTTDTAYLLGKVFGTTPQFWLNLQYLNELWKAEHNQELAAKVKKAQPLIAA